MPRERWDKGHECQANVGNGADAYDRNVAAVAQLRKVALTAEAVRKDARLGGSNKLRLSAAGIVGRMCSRMAACCWRATAAAGVEGVLCRGWKTKPLRI